MDTNEHYELLEKKYGLLKELDMSVYQRSFVSGDPDGNRLRAKYFIREKDSHIIGHVWFGPGSEGPPGFAHGGSISAVLDESMGAASWLNGHVAVAARLTTEFKEMIPLDTHTMLEAWVENIEGKKVSIRAILSSFDGKPYAEAESLFIAVSMDKFENYSGEMTPEEIMNMIMPKEP